MTKVLRLTLHTMHDRNIKRRNDHNKPLNISIDEYNETRNAENCNTKRIFSRKILLKEISMPEHTIPLTEAQNNLTRIADQLEENPDVITVTLNEEPVLAILPVDTYKLLLQTIEENIGEPANRVELGAPHGAPLAPPRIEEQSRKIERDVLRQIPPQQRGRHVLDERPDHVAFAVIHRKIAAVSAQARADVVHDRRVHVHAAITT